MDAINANIDLFPAQAGVILPAFHHMITILPVPRASGGDPATRTL